MFLRFFVSLTILVSSSSLAKVHAIAHRGASAYAPENTISALKKAISLKAKYLEIDVHMTKDGEVVAIHDSTIDRTSNAKGKINNYNLEDLKKLDFGSWFSKDFKSERLPTLKETLELITNDQVLIIEVKYGKNKYKDIEKKIVNLVESTDKQNQVILKSFDQEVLKEFKKLAPNMERLYCTFWGNNTFTIDNFFRFRGIFSPNNFKYLQVHKFFLSEDLIKQAHKRGIKVVVWDVHDIETMKKFKKMNVDFIETDNPDYILKL